MKYLYQITNLVNSEFTLLLYIDMIVVNDMSIRYRGCSVDIYVCDTSDTRAWCVKNQDVVVFVLIYKDLCVELKSSLCSLLFTRAVCINKTEIVVFVIRVLKIWNNEVIASVVFY